jgi:hypothetical protein
MAGPALVTFPHTGPAERPVPGNTIHRVEPPSRGLTLAYDYNQLYLRDAAHELSTDGNDYLDALDAATRAGLTVGAAAGIADVLMPRQENFSAKLEVNITKKVGRGRSRSRSRLGTTAPASAASTLTLPRPGHTTTPAIPRITIASNSGLSTNGHSDRAETVGWVRRPVVTLLWRHSRTLAQLSWLIPDHGRSDPRLYPACRTRFKASSAAEGS